MDPGLIWILGGFALLAAELFSPGVYLMWVGIAAVAAGLWIWGEPHSFAESAVVFLVTLVGSIAVGIALRPRRKLGAPEVNTPGSGLRGRHGTVLSATGTELRVRVGDSDWTARLAHHGPVGEKALEPGSRVRVVAVEGTTLVVLTEGPPPAH
jgi:membrane protein implicated in regulation of membrane protease activity